MNKIKLHPKYQPLFKDHDCRYVIMTGGRGSGKSYALAVLLRHLMTCRDNATFLYTRWTKSSAFASIIKEFEEKITLLGHDKRTSKRGDIFIDTITGSELLFRGIQTSSGNQTANLKSLTNLSMWLMDEAEELVDEDTFDKISQSVRTKGQQNLIILSLNPSHTNHWIFKRFFEDAGVKSGFNGIKNGVLYIHTTYEDNLANLDESYLADVERTKKQRYNKYLHQFKGEWMDDTEGALWDSDMIRAAKRMYNPNANYQKIVVAVDPSVKADGSNDNCGIVVCGKISDDEFVVLEDFSGNYSPAQWGAKVIKAYRKYEANYIIAEKNNGGALVTSNIQLALDPVERNKVKIELVHASKGKIARAEPISTLYDNNCVSHAPGLESLEFEMITYNGSKGSPGEYDAMVWGLTYLTNRKKQARIHF